MATPISIALARMWASPEIIEATKAKLARYTKLTDSGCMEWQRGLNMHGYGETSVCNGKIKAHRLSWALANGRMPFIGMEICHTCDNRKCINPEHLFEGTPKDNQQDSIKKSRKVYFGHANVDSEKTWNCKWTWADIRSMRSDYAAGVDPKEIAHKYGMKRGYLRKIIANKMWVDADYNFIERYPNASYKRDKCKRSGRFISAARAHEGKGGGE